MISDGCWQIQRPKHGVSEQHPPAVCLGFYFCKQPVLGKESYRVQTNYTSDFTVGIKNQPLVTEVSYSWGLRSQSLLQLQGLLHSPHRCFAPTRPTRPGSNLATDRHVTRQQESCGGILVRSCKDFWLNMIWACSLRPLSPWEFESLAGRMLVCHRPCLLV